MFELNFRDERYLPFEGAGVISRWRIELPDEFRQFDYDTISDVIFQIRYTAREGGGMLKQKAIEALDNLFKADKEEEMLELADGRRGLFRIFSARHEFPNNWHKFLHPKETEDKQTLHLALTSERFPFLFRSKTIQISQVELFLKLKDEKASTGKMYIEEYVGGIALSITLTPPGGDEGKDSLASNPGVMGGLPHMLIPVTNTVPVTFVLEAIDADIQQVASELRHSIEVEGETHHRLKPEAIEDMFIVCHYSVQS